MAGSRFSAAILAGALLLLPVSARAQALELLTEDAFPFQYVENQKLTGMAVEVVAEMFRRAGIAHSDKLTDWKGAYDKAQVYPNTCVYSTARTANRENLFKWIGPIVVNQWAAFARKGFAGKLARPEDLRDYRIGVLQGDAKERYLKDLAAPFRVAVAADADVPAKLSLNRTEPGKVDLWVTGYYTGLNIAAKAKLADVVPVWVFETTENYLACHLGLPQATAQKLQSALNAMTRDGTHQRIVARYGQAPTAR